MGTVIQMYSSVVPGDNMASIDVPMPGNLVGVDWTVSVAASGADFAIAVQLSFGSTGQFAVNDSRSVVSIITTSADLTTSGVADTSVNKYVTLPSIPVGQGERLYVHGAGTAVVHTVRACLQFDFDLDRPLARRR